MYLKRNAVPLTILLLATTSCEGDPEITNPTTPPPVTPPQEPSYMEVERAALEALYHATGGDSWENRENWLTDRPLEDWYGVALHAGSGRVYYINLGNNGLTGSIPPEIGNFTNLIELSLGYNDLIGTIPPELGKLTSLKGLSLSSNRLTGQIPPEIGNITSLVGLHLLDNQLTGAIPPELGKLFQLQHLSLQRNELTGSIPTEMGDLWRLVSLHLSENQLTGAIPPELGELPWLEQLWLDFNGLTGSIPPALGGLSSLQALALQANDLAGAFPDEIGNLERLTNISVSDNPRLSGLLPRSLLNLKEMAYLYVGGTGLCVPLDPGFRRWMEGMQATYVTECDVGVVERMALAEIFKGTGGEAWENGEGWNTDTPLESWHGVTVEKGRVRSLLLANNGLDGSFPQAIVTLTELEQLDLSNNSLTGSLPWDIGHISSLTNLHLGGNSGLDGLFPFSMVRMARLAVLHYEDTGLCLPPTRGFEGWAADLEVLKGPFCTDLPGVALDLPMAYLVQAIQKPGEPVPLVANRDALIRVFLTAPELHGFIAPAVVVTFHRNDVQVHQVRIEAPSPELPAKAYEKRLYLSYNAVVPAEHIQPGLGFSVEADPDGSLLLADDAKDRYPAVGYEALSVVAGPAMDLTVVPVLTTTNADSSVLELESDFTKDHHILKILRWAFPFSTFEARSRKTYVTSTDLTTGPGVSGLLLELEALRASESDSGYWYGAALSRTGVVRGLARLGGWVSAGKPLSGELAHEVGHNLNLRHAPCGNAGNADPDFPYLDGQIGAWGYDFGEGALVPPDARDVMGYCQHLVWLSDFYYNKVLTYRAAIAESGDADEPWAEQLVLSGGVFEGELTLQPPYRLVMAPRTQSSSGPYRIAGYSGPDLKFSLRFRPGEDKFGNKYFLFALPVPQGDVDRIVLRGPEGEVVVDEHDARRVTIVRDESGRVRGMLRDWEGDVPAMLGSADNLSLVSYRGLREERH